MELGIVEYLVLQHSAEEQSDKKVMGTLLVLTPFRLLI
jgi:hypothetical protein